MPAGIADGGCKDALAQLPELAFCAPETAQRKAADASRSMYQKALAAKGLRAITTEIAASGEFYFAEDYHQQYLAKNPAGYCGLRGTGVSCPIGADVAA